VPANPVDTGQAERPARLGLGATVQAAQSRRTARSLAIAFRLVTFYCAVNCVMSREKVLERRWR
jgi:hypothetical protein